MFKKTSKFLALSCVYVAMLSTYSPSSSATDNVVKKSKKTQTATKNQQADVHFTQWKEVSVFITDMVAKHGFQADELNAMFEQARYIETARQLMRPAPPGKPKSPTAHREAETAKAHRG